MCFIKYYLNTKTIFNYMEKQLKIQIGVVKRTKKEFDYYQTEISLNEDIITKMKNQELSIEDDAEEHNYKIKKMNEILSESYIMYELAKKSYNDNIIILENMYNNILKDDVEVDSANLKESDELIEQHYQL